MDHPARRERLREPLGELGVDALLITKLVNVRYLSGFTGSNGQLLATADGAVFFTDPRYEDQSQREVDGVELRTYPRRFAQALADACLDRSIARLGFESAGVTHKTWLELAGIEGVELVPTDDVVERL